MKQLVISEPNEKQKLFLSATIGSLVTVVHVVAVNRGR